MNKANYLSSWIRRFLLEHLISIKNLSRNTQQSYRDTFKLCIPYIANRRRKSIDNLIIKDMSPEIIKSFLLNLETNRFCCLATRNQRLAAIHAFAIFIGLNCPEHIEWCRQIRLIPFKKSKHSSITYMEKHEMDSLLNAPNRRTSQGKRDYALLLFLYNTGARASEAAQLSIGDLDIANNARNSLSIVTIKGKGNKLRRCPLWKKTAVELTNIISGRAQNEPVFLNRHCEQLTRFGVHDVVKRYAKKLSVKIASFRKKSVSPHVIRHTTATHLLRSGVDINTIRAWLGHVSINTTNIYAEVDLEMKEKALACCEGASKKKKKNWRSDNDLMAFLKSI